MNRAQEIAWAAGLFDGEGTVTRCRGRARLAVKMTEEAPVRFFHAIVKDGDTLGPYLNSTLKLNGDPRKRAWYWYAEGEEGERVCLLLGPHMQGERKAKMGREFGITFA